MERGDSDIAGLVDRAESLKGLLGQLGDDLWVSELQDMLRRAGWAEAADQLMVELTLADVERSAHKLLELRANLLAAVADATRPR